MNFTEINKALESGSISPIYILEGDAFFAEQTIKTIINHFGLSDLSVTLFNDENFDARSAICACQQFSFFNEKRVVIISDISKELNSEAKQLFSSYIKNPNKDCILLIKNTIASKTFDSFKDVPKIECKASEYFCQDYITNFFKQKGITPQGNAAKKIITYCLQDFTRINIELKKLAAYLNGKQVLTEQDVDDLVYKDTELKVFDLTTALSSKNIKKAQDILTQMFMAEEQPTKIIALIYSHFRRLFFVKLNKDKTNAELAKLLNVKEFAILKAKEQAAPIHILKLKQTEELCLNIDFMIKDGQMSPENAVYFLVYKIYTILST